MAKYVFNVMSDDHPGIIAAVTSAVESLHGNIESCSQTVLGGYFTLIMIVDVEGNMPPEDVREQILEKTAATCKIDVSVRLAGEDFTTGEKTETFVITAFGKDQGGIVRRFSEYLADHEMNITDMYGARRRRPDGEMEFLLTGQVEIPSKWNFTMLQCDLESLGKELGFTVRLQHENIFTATNRLRYRS
ncbi:MAG: ACT domain-containing protein [Planctomycetia bacterium]|nr:ACT domain-containing protein [Planctomycetia bacterium]